MLATEMGSLRVDEASAVRPARRPAVPWAERGASASDRDASRPRPEDPELERILKMVEAGELSARDADELLRAMGRA
jgi:hypothetical protein